MNTPPSAGGPSRGPSDQDGGVLDPGRHADVLAVRDLAISYAYAVDDRDWARWEALFTADAALDYTRIGGIAGPPAEVAAWMPDAMAVFVWSLHSILTHEVRFTGPDTATGRVHVFNRNGVIWDDVAELCDVGGVYLDAYRRVGDAWRFTRRVETCQYVTGGAFAAVVRQLVANAVPDEPAPFG